MCLFQLSRIQHRQMGNCFIKFFNRLEDVGISNYFKLSDSKKRRRAKFDSSILRQLKHVESERDRVFFRQFPAQSPLKSPILTMKNSEKARGNRRAKYQTPRASQISEILGAKRHYWRQSGSRAVLLTTGEVAPYLAWLTYQNVV